MVRRIGATEAARWLAVSRQRVHRLAATGRLGVPEYDDGPRGRLRLLACCVRARAERMRCLVCEGRESARPEDRA